MLREFRTFIAQGNVLDLAVGVVIGASFGKITTSLVNDIIMPPIGILLAGVDFKHIKTVLKPAAGDQPEVAMYWGNFFQVAIEFLIIAWVIFMVVKVANRVRLTSSLDKKE